MSEFGFNFFSDKKILWEGVFCRKFYKSLLHIFLQQIPYEIIFTKKIYGEAFCPSRLPDR